MNFAKYISSDFVNGPGVRCTLFVCGCELNCRGCYNQSIQSLKSGQPFSDIHAKKIVSDLQNTRVVRQGLSLLGGDPLHPANVADIKELLQLIKANAPNKDIWCWTGYELESLNSDQHSVLKYIDVLIDGPFILEQKTASLVWRGSRNQRVIQLNKESAL